MSWAEKEADWEELVATIKAEIDANRSAIPEDRIEYIEHYLLHGEYSMAFEFLYLEIMERDNSVFYLGVEKARKLALFFDLNDEDECMVDHKFWSKFLEWSEQFTNT